MSAASATFWISDFQGVTGVPQPCFPSPSSSSPLWHSPHSMWMQGKAPTSQNSKPGKVYDYLFTIIIISVIMIIITFISNNQCHHNDNYLFWEKQRSNLLRSVRFPSHHEHGKQLKKIHSLLLQHHCHHDHGEYDLDEVEDHDPPGRTEGVVEEINNKDSNLVQCINVWL